MPTQMDMIGLALCNCCKRYEPWSEEELKTNLEEYKTPTIVKLGDKMGKREVNYSWDGNGPWNWFKWTW